MATQSIAQTLVVLDDITIRQDNEGRFCLNDLHRAAGGAGKDRPNHWLRLEETRQLMSDLGYAIKSKQGYGTFACLELVYAYAAWISPKFWKLLLSQVIDWRTVAKALNEFEVPDDLPDLFVYAIRAVDTGHIKLGISRDPRTRLAQLQTANSSKLELVAYKPATNRFADEAQLHREYQSYLVRGEWFTSAAQGALQ